MKTTFTMIATAVLVLNSCTIHKVAESTVAEKKREYLQNNLTIRVSERLIGQSIVYYDSTVYSQDRILFKSRNGKMITSNADY